ncbi:MAG TPA: YceI family protein [Thermoplasmataceae archaeon]|nr:YceI family protein [Thermoplasmataceae archaeon]
MKTVGKHLSEWALDQTNTSFEFQIRHMVVSTVHGKFTKFSGIFRGDPENPVDSLVDLVLEGESLDTRDRMRDKKLKGTKFFDVEHYPHVRFWSTGIEVKEENKYKVRGQLKIRDITKEVTLACEMLRPNSETFNFEVNGKVNSEDYGLKWKSFYDPGNVFVGSTVRINVQGRFKLEKTSPE